MNVSPPHQTDAHHRHHQPNGLSRQAQYDAGQNQPNFDQAIVYSTNRSERQVLNQFRHCNGRVRHPR